MSRFRIQGLVGTSVSVMICAAGRAEPPAKADAPDAKPGVAAYVGGEAITIQDLDAKVLKTNMKLAQSLYDARRAAIDQIVMERTLGPEAAARGITVDQLIKERIAEKAKPVTDADVEAYYKGNSARMGGKTLEQASAQIKNFLATQQESEARNTLLSQIKEKAQVRVTLDVPRVEVAIAPNDPIQGPADAKVTIVEFSDFQ